MPIDRVWEALKRWFLESKPETVAFKDEWIPYLKDHMPLYSRLPDEMKERLHQQIARFVTTTYFEGCGGLELTNEMILSVAGQACLLTVNQPGDPRLSQRAARGVPGT